MDWNSQRILARMYLSKYVVHRVFIFVTLPSWSVTRALQFFYINDKISREKKNAFSSFFWSDSEGKVR